MQAQIARPEVEALVREYLPRAPAREMELHLGRITAVVTPAGEGSHKVTAKVDGKTVPHEIYHCQLLALVRACGGLRAMTGTEITDCLTELAQSSTALARAMLDLAQRKAA